MFWASYYNINIQGYLKLFKEQDTSTNIRGDMYIYNFV